MTCIVGIADGKSVWIGGDSAGVTGLNLRVRADAKVFVNGPMVFGFTSSFRMGQLLHHSLVIPRQFEGHDDQWLCSDFVNAVRACLKDGGFATTHDGAESGGEFLIGYRGHLYVVHSDYQISDPADQFAAVGCGDNYALGSLLNSIGKPEQRIREALETAAHFSAGVSAPFVVLEGGKP